MRKSALVFLLAIVAPSLVLAWLALRSLRDQQFVLERQETLLGQGVADSIANEILGQVNLIQRDFARQVEEALGTNGEPAELAYRFDTELRKRWTNAAVGFAVALGGAVVCPSPTSSPAACRFRLDNDQFLCSRESVEVVWNSPKGRINLTELEAASKALGEKSVFATKNNTGVAETPVAGQFREIVGDSSEGTLARFLQNQLHVLLWHRTPRDMHFVFGAELRLDALTESFRPLVKVDPSLSSQWVAYLRDDGGHVIAASDQAKIGASQRAMAVSALGDALPHWEVAVFPRNPGRVNEVARTLRATLGLLVCVLVLAIAVGSWLIALDLRRQLTLARQKTDFVSNVSHELKTPLTSIRMFAEMLAEGRAATPEKQQHFLNIITSETARLSRLINNVLDFARRERGDQKWQPVPCDLAQLTRATLAGYRPHLETAGFVLEADVPETPVTLLGDGDALSQVLVNLLSNAEKYSGDRKEITVRLRVVPPARNGMPRQLELTVLDRGTGVPRGCEEKIFEQFFRAHDSLASGIPGSGLGLTLARQIARAHGGDIRHSPREGGGSAFTVTLPATDTETETETETAPAS